MKNIKIALINIHVNNDSNAFPLASFYLKQAIAISKYKKFADIEILEFFTDYDLINITEKINNKNYDGIGFSIYSWNTSIIKKIIDELKCKFIFAGGPEVTADAYDLLNNVNIDLAISGSGEKPFVEVISCLVEEKPLSTIKNIELFNGKYILKSDNSQELLLSPFIKSDINWNKYSGVLWELSRGCPFKCAFCFESKNNNTITHFPINRIKKELNILKKNKITHVFVLDPTFNYNKKRSINLLNIFIKNKSGIHFNIEIRIELLDEETVKLFSRLNCSLQAGLQSTDSSVLKKLNRSFNKEVYYKNTMLLNKYNIIFGLDLIYGLPGQTIDSFKESLDFALDLTPNHLDIFPLSLLKGTNLYDKRDEHQFTYNQNSPYTVISTPSMTENDMKIAGDLKKGVDILYNQIGAVGWFKILLSVIEQKPSELLLSFITFYKNSNKKQSDIDIILNFIKESNILFDVKTPLTELIILHYSMKKSLLKGSSKKTHRIKKNHNNYFLKLSDSTVLLKFTYSPDNLLMITPSDNDLINIESEIKINHFTEIYSSDNYNIVIYNNLGKVDYIILEDDFFNILNTLKQETSLTALYSYYDLIDQKDIYNFILYCNKQGIIETSKIIEKN